MEVCRGGGGSVLHGQRSCRLYRLMMEISEIPSAVNEVYVCRCLCILFDIYPALIFMHIVIHFEVMVDCPLDFGYGIGF